MTDEDLAEELFSDTRPTFGLDLESADQAYLTAAEVWLTARIDALTREREAEKADFPQADWDEVWLSKARAVGKRAGGVRHRLHLRRMALQREARIEIAAKGNDLARQTFLHVVKERLGEAAYRDIWEAVYQRHPLLRLRELQAAETGA